MSRTYVEVVGGDAWQIAASKEEVLATLTQGGFVDLVTWPNGVTITINAALVVKVTDRD